jgi:DNA-binding NarL/FixJ family response regulator
LLDLKLPYVMGLDVLKWIRQQPGALLPVVMFTASAEDKDISAAYRLGANAFLTKPSEACKLEEIVRAIKDFWLTHNTPPQESWAESPTEGVVNLVNSFPTGFGAKRRPTVNGTRRQELACNTGVSL